VPSLEQAPLCIYVVADYNKHTWFGTGLHLFGEGLTTEPAGRRSGFVLRPFVMLRTRLSPKGDLA